MAASFSELLHQAVSQSGIISTAYRQFHNYSLGNQLLALGQCLERGIQPGPLATFPKWKEMGRHVRRGEKAITLCQPVTIKRKADATEVDDDEQVFTRFVYRPHWFVLAQTDGQEIAATLPPSWDRVQALAKLEIEEVPFDLTDGNCLGFARGRQIAISPINPMPHKTLFHEVAHVLLGHTSEGEQNETPLTPRSLRECEAEAVALLCCEALGLPGATECRGYIQAWWRESEIPERSAQKIMKVADQILRAGEVQS